MVQEEMIIIAAFKNRDAKAFAHIFRMHRKPLVYFAEKILGIKEEAEDIVADSFMKLWDRHADFDSLPKIRSFLYITTKNACLNFLKYSKRVSDSQKEYSYWADNKDDEILHIMYMGELLAMLNKEIDILPRKCMNIFQLAFYEGLGTNEIAARLGLSVKTVRSQKAKAVELIRISAFKKNLLVSVAISLAFLFEVFLAL